MNKINQLSYDTFTLYHEAGVGKSERVMALMDNNITSLFFPEQLIICSIDIYRFIVEL
jgi:hypothetical protein